MSNDAGGTVVYWGAPMRGDIEALDFAWSNRGSDVQEIGDVIKVATVLDPRGNIFGNKENPTFCAAERMN